MTDIVQKLAHQMDQVNKQQAAFEGKKDTEQAHINHLRSQI
jgi:hypothetical protein